jgi:hypothetical protein
VNARATVAFASLASLALLALLACEDGAPPTPCVNAPPNGCPLSGADVCKDPSCDTAYACQNGKWVLDHTCAPRGDAGSDGQHASDAYAISRDGSFDAPPGADGGPGCVALQPPDCALATALACPDGCCGCGDLFVCTNGGWNAWGQCSADAGIVPTK